MKDRPGSNVVAGLCKAKRRLLTDRSACRRIEFRNFAGCVPSIFDRSPTAPNVNRADFCSVAV
jgi:hypothetical protein